jgi:hypothetical protein
MTIEIHKPYQVYLDDSTQDRHGQKVVAITGYLATVEAWLKFEDDWRGVLRRGPFPYFHTTDFLARQPPFNNGWSDAERNEFMERITVTASEYPTLGIGCAIICDEYERAFPTDIFEEWKDPRLFALFGLLCLLSGTTDKKNTRFTFPQPLHFLVERQKHFVGNAIELFYAYKDKMDKEHRFADIAHGSREEYLPLQAADLLVYETTRKLVEQIHDPHATMRKPFGNLARKGNLVLLDLREDMLRKYVELLREERLGTA